MSKPLFIRTLAGLSPENDEARESLRGLGLGELVAVEVKRPRNLAMLRLYWLLCSTIGEAIGAERETISDVLKIRTGHFITVQTKAEVLKFPRSISFAKMTEQDFRKFFDRCCAEICATWIPHMKADELREQIEELVGARHHSANPTPHKRKRAA